MKEDTEIFEIFALARAFLLLCGSFSFYNNTMMLLIILVWMLMLSAVAFVVVT